MNTRDIDEITKTYIESLYEIDWNNKNQTIKLLKKYYYEQLDEFELFTWHDEKDDDLKNTNIVSEKDMNDLMDIFDEIAIYISAFSNKEESKVDTIKEHELAVYFFSEMKLDRLSPIMDKIVAYCVVVFLHNQEDVSDCSKNRDELISIFLRVLASYELFDREYKENHIPDEVLEQDKDIDTSGLHIGDVVKNYKELCSILNQEIKSGKAKKIQLDDFKRYFDWEKSGQKFIITDVYDYPLPKEDKRKLGNNSIYVQSIEVILLQYLSQQTGYTRTLTKRSWWELLGIVNHKYNKIPHKQLEQLDYTVTPFEIKHFYQRCNKKLEQILFSALHSLESRKLITYEIQTVIVKHTENKKETYFLADDKDKKRILQAERFVLKNVMGYEKIIQVFCRFKQSEYYKKVNERINDLYGWDHYFKQIKIIYTPEDVREALPELKVQLQKELLNQKIISVLNNNAEELYTKKKEEYTAALQDKSSKELWKFPDTYLSAQHILTDELIKIGHKGMTFSSEDFLESNAELDRLFQIEYA